MFSTHSTKAFWSRLHYSFSCPSLCLHLYFITRLQDLKVSELSLTSLPMQSSCFFFFCFFFFCNATSTFWVLSSSLPPFSDSRLYFPLSAPPTRLFSHCHLPLTPFVFSFSSSLSLKCLCFLSIWFLPLCFHLSLSGGGCSPPLYANNVPVLREEAA